MKPYFEQRAAHNRWANARLPALDLLLMQRGVSAPDLRKIAAPGKAGKRVPRTQRCAQHLRSGALQSGGP
jgi:hypothetical protein